MSNKIIQTNLIFTKSTSTAYPFEKLATSCIFHDNGKMCWSQTDLQKKIVSSSFILIYIQLQGFISFSFYYYYPYS